MAADGKLVLLALAAVGEGIAAYRFQLELMGATGRNAEHRLHHPLPLFAVRRDAAKVLPHQQMRQLVRHHFFDKRLLIFHHQHRVEADLIRFQPGGTCRGATLLIDQLRFRIIAAELQVGLGEFFPQAAHNGLLNGDGETGCFHRGRA